MKPMERITSAEEENNIILENFEDSLKNKFNQYYESIGKHNYTLSVKEEVQKI